MAASANTSAADNNQNEGGGGVSSGNGGTGNSIPVPNNSRLAPTEAALKHSPGLSDHWTPDEQILLQDLLLKYASDSAIIRYAKVSVQLQDKTVRDVALRCRHMNKKENGKRRKEDPSSLKKNKDKREKVADPSAKASAHPTNRSSGPPYVQTLASMDSDDGISYKAIGGATGQLLEKNAQAMDQISANFGAFKIHDNINLFCQARNNILSILNDLNINDFPEIMKQMPPLPVKINEEIAGSILPPSLHTKS